MPPRPKTIFTPEHRRLAVMLRELRERQGLTQDVLAAQLQRPQSFVSKYEHGERRIDLVELRAICLALGTSLPSFVRRYEASVQREG